VQWTTSPGHCLPPCAQPEALNSSWLPSSKGRWPRLGWRRRPSACGRCFAPCACGGRRRERGGGCPWRMRRSCSPGPCCGRPTARKPGTPRSGLSSRAPRRWPTTRPGHGGDRPGADREGRGVACGAGLPRPGQLRAHLGDLHHHPRRARVAPRKDAGAPPRRRGAPEVPGAHALSRAAFFGRCGCS
jgi:hypothetical protein